MIPDGALHSHLQNTSLTTLGILREGLRVSPAVIPRLSVPPSVQSQVPVLKISQKPTSKTSRYKHSCKSSEATNERSTGYRPVMSADIGVRCVDADIDEYANDNEHDNCYYLKEGKPIFYRVSVRTGDENTRIQTDLIRHRL